MWTQKSYLICTQYNFLTYNYHKIGPTVRHILYLKHVEALISLCYSYFDTEIKTSHLFTYLVSSFVFHRSSHVYVICYPCPEKISFYSPWPSGDIPGRTGLPGSLRRLASGTEPFDRSLQAKGQTRDGPGRDTDGRTARWDDAAGRMVISWA